MRLIDADAAGCAKCPHWDYSSPCINGNEFYCPMLEKYTPADFYCKYGLEEPVVRCKECKWWHKDDEPDPNGRCECNCNGGWWLPEDYCSCGERRDDNATG